jgi:tRNA 2-selenouridine synthase
MPGDAQPSQKQFESLIWDRLQRFTRDRPVWVESESRRIGQCHLPDSLIHAIRNSSCVLVEASLGVRTRLLLSEYQHFTHRPDDLLTRLDRLIPLHGHAQLDTWRQQIRDGHWETFVESLLHKHYDPAYDRSMQRNYLGLEQAHAVAIEGDDNASLERATRALLFMED